MNKLSFCAATAGALLLAFAGLTQAGPVTEKLLRGDPLILAHREASLPFSFMDENKQPVGYAVDLCTRIADSVRQQLGLKQLPIRYKLVNSSTRIEIIRSHQADLECGSTTNTPDRRQLVAFTVPHYIASARVLVRADSTAQELFDFAGKRLVGIRNTTGLARAKQANQQQALQINIIEVLDDPKALDMLEKKEVDGFIMDDVVLQALRATRPDPNQLKVVGKPLTVEPLAIMLPKDDPEFKKLVDEAMKQLIRTREAHTLYHQWFNQPRLPGRVNLALPMPAMLREFWQHPSDMVPF